MGFRFRKSLKFGPFRVTASKSGLSYSAGVKGARVTRRADGRTQTTLSVPGTGLSHVSTTSGTTRTTSAADQPREMTREEQMRDYYDMGTKKQGCGCAIALAVFMALLLVACNALF